MARDVKIGKHLFRGSPNGDLDPVSEGGECLLPLACFHCNRAASAVSPTSADMQGSLDCHLKYEEYSKDFIANTLFIGLYLASEDVAKAEKTFREVVVGPGEVECSEAKGVYRVEGCQGVEMSEEIFLYSESGRRL
jgi:hypothetical protein